MNYPESGQREIRMTAFIPIFWSLVVLAIVVNNYADISMKVQVNQRLPEQERFSWWSRSSWAVARKYAEFYPDSNLPLIGLSSFWLCIVLGAAFLASTIWTENRPIVVVEISRLHQLRADRGHFHGPYELILFRAMRRAADEHWTL